MEEVLGSFKVTNLEKKGKAVYGSSRNNSAPEKYICSVAFQHSHFPGFVFVLVYTDKGRIQTHVNLAKNRDKGIDSHQQKILHARSENWLKENYIAADIFLRELCPETRLSLLSFL